MITKDRALEVLHENIQNKNLRKHHYGVAAAMKGLAVELDGDPEKWEIVGLLHDADYEKSQVIIMVRTQNGLDKLYTSNLKLGGQASIAAGPVGAGASSNIELRHSRTRPR